jgi:acyl-CoA thioesterase-1
MSAVAAMALLAPALSPAQAQTAAPACIGPAEVVRLNYPLPHLSEDIARGRSLTIVAIGSSSTAGAGASTAAASYPSRLEALLRARFVGESVTVLNRGVGGEEIRNMLARFDRDVIAAKPDLVLWQLGTNSVLHDHPFIGNGAMLADGLNRLKATGADVVLINPQYAPKVLAKPAVEAMVELISATAKQSGVGVFDRFGLMKYWREGAKLPFETFLSPDLLHMNDWGYYCVAELLSVAVADTATRARVAAAVPVARQ